MVWASWPQRKQLIQKTIKEKDVQNGNWMFVSIQIRIWLRNRKISSRRSNGRSKFKNLRSWKKETNLILSSRSSSWILKNNSIVSKKSWWSSTENQSQKAKTKVKKVIASNTIKSRQYRKSRSNNNIYSIAIRFKSMLLKWRNQVSLQKNHENN